MANKRSTAGLGHQIRTLFSMGTLGAMPDRALLDHFARRGESAEPAFATLVERHGPMVLRLCRNLLADTHLAEDAFQVTFLLLARRASSIHNPDALAGWLHRVARRVALRARARTDQRKVREQPQAAEVAVVTDNPVERDEVRAIVHQEIDRLDDSQRLPIVLCALEGLSHEEAAQRLQWPVGTVKSRLVRGRRKLESRLARRGLATAIAIAAVSGTEASAAVPLVLAVATTRIAAAGAKATNAAVMSASVAMLLKKELSAMSLVKLKLVAGAIAAAGAAVVLIGVTLAGPLGRNTPTVEPQVAKAQAPAVTVPIAPKAKTDGPKNPRSPMKLSASGRVVGADGKPVAGATVFFREWAIQRARELLAKGLEPLPGETLPDILGQAKTDDTGGFHFAEVLAPAFTFQGAESFGKTVFPWDVVTYAPGHGIAWCQITPSIQRRPIILALPAEGVLHGRLLEPDGKPIAGARLRVAGIDRLGHVDPRGVETDGRLNLSWSSIPLVVTSGADGTFTLRGLPRAIVAFLIITDPRHELKVIHAATTDQPQPDITRTTVIQDQTLIEKEPIYGERFDVTLRPLDHRLAGRVVFAATGEAASGAQVRVGHRKVAETGADGTFVVENLAAGEIELHLIAWKTDAGPLELRITMPDEPKSFKRTFSLPPGLVVKGRVLDDQTGAGIKGVQLNYGQRTTAGELPTIFGFATNTGSDGRFQLVVPAGRGSLEVWQAPLSYPNPLPSTTNPKVHPRLKLEFSGKPGETIQGLTFRLGREKPVIFTVLDPDGRPVAGAEVHRRGRIGGNEPPSRTDAAGQCELAGVDRAKGATFDVIHPSKPLGTRVVIRPGDLDAAQARSAIEVKLERTASLKGRVLDDEGKPLTDPVVLLYSDVQYPQLLGTPVTTASEVRDDGSFSFDRLLAGTSYFVQISAGGHASMAGEHIRAKAGEVYRPEEFRIPAADQELRGIVVDPRGQPVAGVSVSRHHTGGRQLIPPRGPRWFMQTDSQGRFYLADLPKGPLTLTAYRNPEGPNRTIRNMVRVEAQAGVEGGKEVKIVLPDASERLRGIE